MKWGEDGVGWEKMWLSFKIRVQSVVVSNPGCTLEFPGLLNIFIIRPDINKLASNICGHAEVSVFSNIF